MRITFSSDCPRGDIENFLSNWHSESTFFEATSSGSTGTPKRIRIEKKHAIASAKATVSFLELKAGDSALMSLNPETIGGKMMLVRAAEHDLRIHCIRPQANPLKEIDSPFDFISLAPLQMATILEETPEKLMLAKQIIIGGGTLSDKHINMLADLGHSVYQTFGMTETISHFALRSVGKKTDYYYQTLEGISISKEVDNTLIVHAPTLGQERLKTNDIVEIEGNRYFKWLGRADFTINTGGIKVQIETLEKHLSKLLPCPFFIWWQDHDKLGQQIVLVVEGIIQEAWKTKAFYQNISPFHIPKLIGNIDTMKRSKSDKILRLPNYENVIAKNGFESVL